MGKKQKIKGRFHAISDINEYTFHIYNLHEKGSCTYEYAEYLDEGIYDFHIVSLCMRYDNYIRLASIGLLHEDLI